MISASEFRKGSKFLYKNQPYIVAEFQHVKPGKGGAFVRTKMKNMISGLMHEETFRTEEKFPTPDLEYKKMQFLYSEGESYYFMDCENYEQEFFNKKELGDVVNYLREQEVYNIVFFEAKPIEITPPTFMELKVTETVPGIRGDTAQGSVTKPATLESGLVLNIPLFVNEGDYIKVDTRDGSYIERVKK